MLDVSERFWSASLDELKRGYAYDREEDRFVCLVCGVSFVKGVIYPDGSLLYEAEKFAAVHIAKEHGSMFDYLLQLNKKLTGLTDLQKNLLAYFHRGYDDRDIVKALGGGSTSTIRNHRFTLREKEKQAKLFLAIMELVGERTERRAGGSEAFISVHRTATMLDERYAITEQENADILRTYFKQGLDGPLAEFPKKEKRKIAILRHIAGRFAAGRQYTEKEVNALLEPIFPDYATLRRYLIAYGFLDRYDDCSYYWLKQ